MISSKTARSLKVALCIVLTFALMPAAIGCKPTDFFTEVIISERAEKVDEFSEVKITVNSPDASEESSDMAALDWSDDAARSVTVQKLVVYSKNPNTDLTTHHSVYDLFPRFAGIEASDGVRLVYDSEAELDSPVQASGNDERPDEAESVGQGGRQAPESDSATSMQEATGEVRDEQDASRGELSGQSAEGGGSGGAASGEPRAESGGSGNGSSDSSGGSAESGPDQAGNDGASDSQSPGQSGAFNYELPGSEGGSGPGDGSGNAPDGSDSDPGNTGGGSTDDPDDSGGGASQDPYGGYGGTVPWYGEDGVYSIPPSSDRVAVLGTDALVLARAIGGPGSVCATSRDAWLGLDLEGNRRAYSYYGQVYSAESSDAAICWDGAGTQPAECNIDALIEACGQNGVIVYDQRLGNQQTFFTDDQRRELYAAGITLVPVELSSVQGIIDAANLLGVILEHSAVCESTGHDARKYADDYMAFIDDVVRACAATRTEGGSWLATDAYWASLGSTVYWGCPVTLLRGASAYALISDDSESGMAYYGDIDVSDIVLFRTGGSDAPLIFWQQVAGVWDGAYKSRDKYGASVLFWPALEGMAAFYLNSYDDLSGSSGGAYSRFLGSQYGQSLSSMVYIPRGSIDGVVGPGLGSGQVPYLIVSAPRDSSGGAGDVKNAVIASMMSADASEGMSLYSVLPRDDSGPHYGDSDIYSTIGFTGIQGDDSPFLKTSGASVALDSTVRENPTGLLGDWTGGSMESVLEAVWLTDLYSHAPAGSSYEPVNDMSKFSISVGGRTCTNTRDTVLAFYDYFYDVDASAYYGQIVTDQGL